MVSVGEAPAIDTAAGSTTGAVDIDMEPAMLAKEPTTHQTTADAAPTSDEANGDETNGTSTDPVEWRGRMWFVKVPRPQEDSTLLALEQEHNSLKAQMNLLTESLKIKRVEKESIETARRGADAVWKKCKEALAAREQQLAPIRELRQRRNALAEELAGFKDLTVRSEAELDKAVVDMEARIAQETMTLNEEKALMAAVRKLRSQRERVQQYVVKSAEMTKLRDELKALEGSLDAVDDARRALREELDTAWNIRQKYIEEERGVREVMDGIAAERNTVRELRDAAWERLMHVKTPKQAKSADFYSNRKFSKEVRELLAAGKVDEAQAKCAAQTDEAMARLAGDDEYRVDYVRLFDLQRPRKFMIEEEEEDAPTGPSRKKGPAERPPLDPEEAKRKAQALIESTLAQATATARAEAAAAAASAAATPPPAAPTPDPPLAPMVPVQVVPRKVAKPKPVALQEAALPEALAAEDKFELPQYIRQGEAPRPAAEAPPAPSREQQAAAAAEAAARKERRRQQAERRRAMAEAEAAAREAAARDRALAAAREEVPTPVVAEPEAPVANPDSSDAPNASGGESQMQRRMGKGAGGPRGTVRPRPKARAPPRRSKWSIDALLSNEHAVTAIGVVLILLMMMGVYAFWKFQ